MGFGGGFSMINSSAIPASYVQLHDFVNECWKITFKVITFCSEIYIYNR